MAHEEPQKTVLVVEDDDGWARLIGDEVADAGYRPVRARSIEDAQRRLNQEDGISLVVLDILFGPTLQPRGIELAQWMKHGTRWASIPIVFCSVVGKAEIGAQLKDLKTGDDVIFEKPFDFKEFSDKIKAILREKPP